MGHIMVDQSDQHHYTYYHQRNQHLDHLLITPSGWEQKPSQQKEQQANRNEKHSRWQCKRREKPRRKTRSYNEFYHIHQRTS